MVDDGKPLSNISRTSFKDEGGSVSVRHVEALTRMHHPGYENGILIIRGLDYISTNSTLNRRVMWRDICVEYLDERYRKEKRLLFGAFQIERRHVE